MLHCFAKTKFWSPVQILFLISECINFWAKKLLNHSLNKKIMQMTDEIGFLLNAFIMESAIHDLR